MEAQSLVKSAAPLGISRETAYEVWRSKRNDFVGSSDIATVMGISRYETPLELWARRTGKVKKEWVDSRASRYGRKVESVILELFQEDHPELEIYPNKLTYVSKKYPFALATPDSIAIRKEDQEIGLVEVKHTSFGFESWGANKAPTEAHIQVVWQMGILEFIFAHITAVVGGRADEPVEPLFIFDEVADEIFQQCLEKAEAFVKCVKEDIPPGAGKGDLKIVQKMIQEAEGIATMNDEMMKILDVYTKQTLERRELESKARAIKTKSDDLKAKLLMAAGGKKIAAFPDGREINMRVKHKKGSVQQPTSWWEIDLNLPDEE